MRSHCTGRRLVHVVVLVVLSHVCCAGVGDVTESGLVFFPKDVVIGNFPYHVDARCLGIYSRKPRIDIPISGCIYLKTGIGRERPLASCIGHPSFYLSNCISFHVTCGWTNTDCVPGEVNDGRSPSGISEPKFDFGRLACDNWLVACPFEAHPRSLFQVGRFLHVCQLFLHDFALFGHDAKLVLHVLGTRFGVVFHLPQLVTHRGQLPVHKDQGNHGGNKRECIGNRRQGIDFERATVAPRLLLSRRGLGYGWGLTGVLCVFGGYAGACILIYCLGRGPFCRRCILFSALIFVACCMLVAGGMVFVLLSFGQ